MNFRKPRHRSVRKSSLNVMTNTEKWKKYGRKTSTTRYSMEDTESDDEEQYIREEIFNLDKELFETKSTHTMDEDQDMEVYLSRKQTLILSTLLPDEILLMEKFDNVEPKHFVGVLMMADVSGFTPLSDRYNSTGKGGTYRLTATLNTYLGSLIELIYSHGGDVFKFAGDAFLAVWKTDKSTFLCHTIHSVIACALIIQHSYATYETDVKVNLKVKLAISAGNLIFSPIGSGIDMNYVIVGLPVQEAKIAESLCASGEVQVTPTAWGHCYSRNYDYILKDDGHIIIKSILYDPREKNVTKPYTAFGSLIQKQKKIFTALESLPDRIWDDPKYLSTSDIQIKQEALEVRSSILASEERDIGSKLRKFMIRPVLTQIDAHQPLEYLTEMRQVSVLFITMKPQHIPHLEIITLVNNAYKTTTDIVYKSMGCVNKIILFDKDIMILVIFGLRGFKHETEAQAALKCGCSIKKSLSTLDGVQVVSIGITTGQVYCGVVGHPLRREFTVIGSIVNKAARLMCNFPHKITCDEATFVKSKMSSNAFTLLPKTELKGIVQPGKIFEYSEDIRARELNNIAMVPPLLGRSDEKKYFQEWLDIKQGLKKDFDALLIVGESRIGKTRLLDWMAQYARNNHFRVCYVTLTTIHSATPYLALVQIINQLLELKEGITGFAKEEKIVQLMKVYDENLCYLNTVLKVRFAYLEGIFSQDPKIVAIKTMQVFIKLLQSLPYMYLVILDDLQNLDSDSWPYIASMFNEKHIFTVMAVSRVKFGAAHSWLHSVFIHESVRKIVLGPLSSTYIAPLACQILDIHAVPVDLCNALRIKCNGNPGLIESFLVHLFSSGALEIKKLKDYEFENYKNEDFQFPDHQLLHPQALNFSDQDKLDDYIRDMSDDELSICVVTEKKSLKTDINVQNFDALVMIQIDALTPYQQLLIKIASVIGNILSRDLLENIMYENNQTTTAKAIKRLFALRIFTCANIKRINSKISNNLSCDCSFEYDPESCDNLPKYAFCKIMKFRNKSTRVTCYELLPINQKREFHTRIVNYLETCQQKCAECGGVVTVVRASLSTFSLDEANYNPDLLNEIEEVESEVISPVEPLTATEDDKVAGLRTTLSEILKRSDERILVHQTSSISIFSTQSIPLPIIKTKVEQPPATLKERSSKRVTISSLNFKDEIHENEKSTVVGVLLSRFREIAEASSLSDWQRIGIVDSQDEIEKSKKTFRIKIEKGVSQTNFKKCTCAELRIVIYEQLVHHAKQADMRTKALKFLIILSELYIQSDNMNGAFPVLEEAEEFLMEKHFFLNQFERQISSGKIYALKAEAFLLSGKLAASKIAIERATKAYHINLLKMDKFLKNQLVEILYALQLNRKKYRDYREILVADSVFCLNIATLIYSALGEESTTRFLVYKALNMIQKSECNIVDICEAIANAIQVELVSGNIYATLNIERTGMSVFEELKQTLKANQVFALGKLYGAAFHARVARGELVSSIRAGYGALVVSRLLNANNVAADIIPDLFYVLMARRRIDEAVLLINESIIKGNNRVTLNCETWYYALCMDMILDGGFQMETPDEINRFAEFALDKYRASGIAWRRLVIGLWTYWLRVDEGKKAKRYESEALSWIRREDEDYSLNKLITAMRLAEGMLESLARKVDDLRKVVDMMELRSLADRELTRLEEDSRSCRVIFPRWLLLKGYSLKLSGKNVAATAYFNQALEEARKISNRLEAESVLAATSNFQNWTQSARSGSFMHYKDGIEKAQGNWHHLMYRMSITREQ